MKYNGTATLSFEVQAENARQAMQIIQKDFENKETEHLVDIQLSVSSPNEEQTKLLKQEQQRIYNKYPDNIMRKLREAQGLDENDISHDEELNSLSPSEAFEEVLSFEGYINCSHNIKSIIQGIYGINIDNFSDTLTKANIYPTEIDQNDISPIQAYINALNQKSQPTITLQEEIE